jgi:hypothetical protein
MDLPEHDAPPNPLALLAYSSKSSAVGNKPRLIYLRLETNPI